MSKKVYNYTKVRKVLPGGFNLPPQGVKNKRNGVVGGTVAPAEVFSDKRVVKLLDDVKIGFTKEVLKSGDAAKAKAKAAAEAKAAGEARAAEEAAAAEEAKAAEDAKAAEEAAAAEEAKAAEEAAAAEEAKAAEDAKAAEEASGDDTPKKSRKGKKPKGQGESENDEPATDEE